MNRYTEFLKSLYPEDQRLMWDYANSMFASQLVSSNLYADESIRDLFQDSIIVLDTNILMYLDLEKDQYSESYQKIERIFDQLNIKPVFFGFTKDEYNKATSYIIDEIEKLRNEFKLSILKESKDPFLLTAISRGCLEDEDFKNFYSTIRVIPEYFKSELEINKLESEEVESAINNHPKKQKLREELNKIYLRRHDRNKNNLSLEHDAKLILGARHLRNNNKKTWILTRDGTVHSYAVETSKAGTYPLAINLETIISLLSINDGGVDFSPSDISPLFSNFIKNDVLFENTTFTLEDLTRMLDFQAEISSLPEERIISIAKSVNQERLKGTDDKQIALKLQREFQSYKLDITDELGEVKNTLQSTKKHAERIEKGHKVLKKNYFEKERKKKIKLYSKERKKKIIRAVAWQFLIVGLISAGLIFLYKNNNVELNIFYSTMIGFFVNVFTAGLSFKNVYRHIYDREYNKKIENLDQEISAEFENLFDEE